MGPERQRRQILQGRSHGHRNSEEGVLEGREQGWVGPSAAYGEVEAGKPPEAAVGLEVATGKPQTLGLGGSGCLVAPLRPETPRISSLSTWFSF